MDSRAGRSDGAQRERPAKPRVGVAGGQVLSHQAADLLSQSSMVRLPALSRRNAGWRSSSLSAETMMARPAG
jgi:hypothetical protein